MANRTTVVIGLSALVLLAASFSLQSSRAAAESGGYNNAIAQIRSIKSQASGHIVNIVAPVQSDLEQAGTDNEAKAIRDGALDEIKATHEAAKDEMWAVVESTDRAPEVEAVYDEEEPELEAKREAAEDEVKELYDEWKFRYDAPPAAEVIAKMEAELANGLAVIDHEVGQYLDDLDHADEIDEADDDRAHALGKVAEKAARAADDIEHEYADRYFDPQVTAAYNNLLGQLDRYVADTNAAIEAEYEAWMNEHYPPANTTTQAPASTTTTTRPRPTTTTTTTVPAPATATTTTTAPASTTTTSTTVPAGATSPGRPVSPDAALLPDLPVAVVDSLRANAQSGPADVPAMPTVGFVSRVVGSQLPAGVAAVAVGPLVVLGLVLDALRAAGTLMVVPWLLLAVYMTGLLRGWRGFRNPAG